MIQIDLSVYGTGTAPIINQWLDFEESMELRVFLEVLDERQMLPKRFGNTSDFQDLLVFVNRENVMVQGLHIRLHDRDRVVVLPALAGG